MSEKDMQDLVNGFVQELRRGTIILGVLSRLTEAQYGYSLVGVLEEKGIQVDPGTLYPLLRRLEKQGLLESQWDTNEARPRKYYLLSETGKRVYEELCAEWTRMAEGVQSLIEPDKKA
ncbi:helix-turn-helix transcriptional regulator [Paenibacillus antri]|uniref:Helix-turn-helix transcriptional regulator n=1 Tax=Paenibacillus antri TaxID=2582848 RepID=A0A5R9G847_9BACL|nr:PadR family transcriptional regulator [Paenibacillus antri]TLS49214.1 helix-turn-helix transcriptional regulator [Paenibacillus antri]